jgi:transcriptional regulator with PAS, ATPase and Fis domain
MDKAQPVTTAVLDCLSDPAILLDEDRRILAANRSYRDAFGDGGPVVGRRCFEVSHHYAVPCREAGESCPLESCRDTGEPCRMVHIHYTPRGEEHQNVLTRPIRGENGSGQLFLEIIQPTTIASARPSRERVVGRSLAFNRVLELVERVAPRSTTVLLLGESGTGKELIAEAVHQRSSRANKPFVPVDCSGLSESLFESELFGHERGAFTGALARKRGLVEAADGGTLFLDEVGDIPPSQQVKLLRLLETGCFRRVGSTEQRQADFRLVCATHQPLKKRVAEGTFREDLYYRISAFPIVLPPLRERPEDVPLLVETIRRRLGCNGRCKVHRDTVTALQSYEFPGNVRELINIMERACLLADGDSVLPHHLPEECLATAAAAPVITCGDVVPLSEIEDRYLRWASARFRGDNRELAHRLGMSERTLYRRLQKLRDGGNGGNGEPAGAGDQPSMLSHSRASCS